MKINLINHTDSPVRIKKDPETGVVTVEVGEPEQDSLAAVISAVGKHLRRDLRDGRGIWGEAARKYGLKPRGSI